MTVPELEEDLEAAYARIHRLEQSVKGGLRWVDRLLRHCKINGLPVTRSVLYDDNNSNETMPKCTHSNPQAVNIYGGEGIEWCPDCGAFRQVSFKTVKSGGDRMSAHAWRVPKNVPHCIISSDITYRG